MIRLNLTSAQAELIRRLLSAETDRLVAEREYLAKTGYSDTVLEATDHDRTVVVSLREELLDAIICAHP